MSPPLSTHHLVSVLLAERRDALRRSDTAEADRIRRDLEVLGVPLAALESRRRELATLRSALSAPAASGVLHRVVAINASGLLHHRLELQIACDPGAARPLPSAGGWFTGQIDRISMHLALQALDDLEPGARVLVELASADPRNSFQPLVHALESGAPGPGAFVVGLSASLVAEEPAGAREVLSIARDLGCLAAVTRFGAGPAGLLGLRGLPFDYLELDPHMCRGLLTRPETQAAIQGSCTVARAHGAAVAAHAVPDVDMLDPLRGLGVDAASGPAIAPARPILRSPARAPREAGR
jgi:EAL domain-containing protein (putative c-di-GMP-specific phosphodiesterase class I)